MTVVLGLSAASAILIADTKGDGGFSGGGDLTSPPNDDFRSSGNRMMQQGTGADPCVADLNNDGIVDGADLSLILGAWATDNCDYNLAGGACFIDGADLSIVLGEWGPCS